MSDDLIDRLMALGARSGYQAATRIKEQADEIARLRAQVEAGEQNYLDLYSKAWAVWHWFEKARPDLIGPRATALGQTLNGPRPYGAAEPPAALTTYQQAKEGKE